MPAALPMMIFLSIGMLFKIIKYSAKTNKLITEIWMDQTGSELTFVFMNRRFRKIFGEPISEDRLIHQMILPQQGKEYRILPGMYIL